MQANRCCGEISKCINSGTRKSWDNAGNVYKRNAIQIFIFNVSKATVL